MKVKCSTFFYILLLWSIFFWIRYSRILRSLKLWYAKFSETVISQTQANLLRFGYEFLIRPSYEYVNIKFNQF